MPLRIAFMGTPEFAVPCLTEIVSAGHEIACVYTQPPRPAGRGQAERKSPVHALAETLGLTVRTPASMRDPDEIDFFAALNLDLAVVVAFGQILPQAVLDAPRLGCINVHASLLPRWRGAAPIQRAILAGDETTGVQIMRMEAGLDTGPILLSESARIFPFDTAGAMHDRLAALGAALLPRALGALERGAAVETPQSAEGVTYAKKIDKAEARIDWTRPAKEIDRLIRSFSPFPGAWFEVRGEKGSIRVKALNARFEADAEPFAAAPGTLLDDALLVAGGDGEGAVRLTELQREGRSVQSADAFLNGLSLVTGDRLS